LRTKQRQGILWDLASAIYSDRVSAVGLVLSTTILLPLSKASLAAWMKANGEN
jgi:hypothetical protein